MKHFLSVTIIMFCLTNTHAGLRQAGVATVIITPEKPLWMAGYASRNKPAEGKLHDLFAKAVCLEDETGSAVILLTTDLIGLPKSLSDRVAAEVMARTGLTRDRLMLTASHTHCGPVLSGNLMDMYDMPPAQWQLVLDYSTWLESKLTAVMIKAYQTRKSARWSQSLGECGFAINRRQPTKTGVVIGLSPDSPVDHRVPVLCIEDQAGKPMAVVFGYACHNTTLDQFQWNGDYAGFAQLAIEKQLGIPALFWTGCGADANPNPRRTVEVAERHGKSLADSVLAALKAGKKDVTGLIQTHYSHVELDFVNQPTKTQLQTDRSSKNFAVRTRAARLLTQWESDGHLPHHYHHYPVQTWSFGNDLTWVSLGGEVVVDYVLRIRSELKNHGTVWVTGYANDVMAYIPSARILNEGGYEADTSMIYYGQPGRWANSIEESILKAVHEQNSRIGRQQK